MLSFFFFLHTFRMLSSFESVPIIKWETKFKLWNVLNNVQSRSVQSPVRISPVVVFSERSVGWVRQQVTFLNSNLLALESSDQSPSRGSVYSEDNQSPRKKGFCRSLTDEINESFKNYRSETTPIIWRIANFFSEKHSYRPISRVELS